MHPKQYGVVLRNELTRRVYRNFGAFPSAGLNRCFGSQKKKYFLYFSLFLLKYFLFIAFVFFKQAENIE